MKKVLIIGAGGREHALMKAISRSRIGHELYVFAETLNPVMKKHSKQYLIITGGSRELSERIIRLCPDLCIIGPEKYLAAAIVNLVHRTASNIKFIGFPSGAAKIETDKAWCRRQLSLMELDDFSPRHRFFSTEETKNAKRELSDYLKSLDGFVVKVNGLAGGKGVKLFDRESFDDGNHCAEEVLEQYGCVLIEERLHGAEFSLMSLTDGKDCAHFPPVRDFKRAYENDAGPNTGGMGAICRDNLVDVSILQQAQILNQKVARHLLSLGGTTHFTGVLYGGFMVTSNNQLKLIEYNARFGDPEIIAALESINPNVDFLKVLLTATVDWLGVKEIQNAFQFHRQSTVYYACPPDYPQTSVAAIKIPYEIFEEPSVYCAGIDQSGGVCYTTKSRSFAFSDSNIVDRFPDVFKTLRWRKDIQPRRREMTYKLAGVDIESANAAVQSIQDIVRSTYTKHQLDVPGGFGGLTYVPLHGEPTILVSSVDSVGSKTEMAVALSDTLEERAIRMQNLGRDIVAHSANDIGVMGCIQPLNFLDYLASHTLNPEDMRNILTGMAEVCRDIGCSISGGETAEIKDTYREGAMDIAGIINGIMYPSQMLQPKSQIVAGDVVFALPSISAHTNGFTLINKIRRRLSPLCRPDKEWLSDLTRPHRCYLPEIRTVLKDHPEIHVKGMAHITGGGLIDNPPRILHETKQIRFDRSVILNQMPPMFQRLWKETGIALDNHWEMFRTFNCGIGLIIVVDSASTRSFRDAIPEAFQVGTINDRHPTHPPVLFQ